VKQAWLERPEGGTAFGYRLLAGFARIFGRTASRVLLLPITFYFFFRRGPERRASRAYLERVTGRRASLWQIAKHIHCFAAVTLDRAFLLSESFRRFDIRTYGLEELRKAWGRQQGVLVFGSHLGSFDALRTLGELRQDVKIRVVIDLEQNPALSRILNSFNTQLARSIINARQEGATTALAIKEALDDKALVTMLVERARPGNAVIAADFLGSPAPFPSAPWQLAAVMKVPVVLCFGLYRGGNRYDLHFELFAHSLSIERRNREAALTDVVQRFADRLAHYVRSAPYNWFNFYDFWQPGKSATPPRPGGGDRNGERAASDDCSARRPA
jgi:predicted LPLAT superfamily acyltransferase